MKNIWGWTPDPEWEYRKTLSYEDRLAFDKLDDWERNTLVAQANYDWEKWWANLPECDICEQKISGSHYHCGQCRSKEVTSCYGHYSYGEFTCKMTPEEKQAHLTKHLPKSRHR